MVYFDFFLIDKERRGNAIVIHIIPSLRQAQWNVKVLAVTAFYRV